MKNLEEVEGEAVRFPGCPYEFECYKIESVEDKKLKCTGFPDDPHAEKHDLCISCKYYINYKR